MSRTDYAATLALLTAIARNDFDGIALVTEVAAYVSLGMLDRADRVLEDAKIDAGMVL